MTIGLLLLAMVYPPLFKPFARVWFAASTVVGTVGCKIVLTAIFFLIVYPVAP